MFGAPQSGANAYARVNEDTGVVGASPHQLIVMLFEGALVAVNSAMQHMKDGNIAAKGQSISKAILIIDGGLRASLNLKVGGEIAANLDALYEYMSKQLLVANLKNQLEALETVHRLLLDLKGAWDAIGEKKSVDIPAPPAAAYDALAPKTSRLVKA